MICNSLPNDWYKSHEQMTNSMLKIMHRWTFAFIRRQTIQDQGQQGNQECVVLLGGAEKRAECKGALEQAFQRDTPVFLCLEGPDLGRGVLTEATEVDY